MPEAAPAPLPPDPGVETAPIMSGRPEPPAAPVAPTDLAAFMPLLARIAAALERASIASEASAPRLLPAEAAAAYCGVSRTSWLDLDQRGGIPAPVRLSVRIVLWDREVLDRWIDLGCPGRARFEEIMAVDQRQPMQPPPYGRRRRPAAS